MYHHVLQFKQKHNVPVIAQFDGIAASGGYYVACAADEIVAQRTNLSGSIGVLLQRFDLSELGDKVGIADGSIVSSGSRFKTVGDPFTELTEEQREYLTSVIDDSLETFKTVVVKARQSAFDSADVTVDDVATGKIFSSQQALELGLIDAVGYPTDAYAAAETRAGLAAGATVVRFERTPTFFEALGAAEGGIAPGVQVDADLIHDMMTPRLMYLWRGE
jgi:protease-4